MKLEMDSTKLLNSLLKAETTTDVDKIVSSLPADRIRWIPFGGITGNKGQIKISTDPVRALVERVTNSFDAVIERGIQENGIKETVLLTAQEKESLGLTSPQKAIEKYIPQPNENYVLVSVTPRERWERCTVDIFDRGIGIRPEMMPNTILSLSGSNKVSKPYQAGMYGQGGASSIGRVSSDGYVLVVSRSNEGPVGFTVVRYENPTADDKRGHYTYMVSTFEPNDSETLMFADVRFSGKDEFVIKNISLPTTAASFPQGTLVRHFGYDLSSYKQQSRNPLSIFRGLNTYLFDALLPLKFLLPEKAGAKKIKWHPRTIEGSKKRLSNKGKSKIEWSSSEPISINVGKDLGTVELEYWVLEAQRKGQGVATQPSDFVHPSRPVIFTLNGQTHGEYSLYEVGSKIKAAIPYTSNSLVMHVALDGLTSPALDNLLSSGREDLVSGKVWDIICGEIESLIIDDTHLSEIDFKRMEMSLASGQVESIEDARLKDSIAQVIEKMSGESITRIFGGSVATPPSAHREAREPRRQVTPITTQDPPTFIRFTSHPDDLLFNPGKRKILHVETDAKDSLGKKIKIDAGKLEVRWSVLEGGHMSVSLQCPEDVKEDTDNIKISLGHLHDTVSYVVHVPTLAEVRAAGEGKTKKVADVKKIKDDGRRGIPRFDIQWTKPGDFNWVSILGLNEHSAEDFAFDFRVKEGAGIILYCSDVFPPFAKQMQSVNGNGGRAGIFKKHYVAQALIHAFRRADEHPQEQYAHVDDDARRAIEMEERNCAATSFAVTAMRMLDEEVKRARSGGISSPFLAA